MKQHSEPGKTRTAEFLRRMEAKRLAKECPYVLDMRGRAPGRIREFTYRERIFYLDDISYTLLTRGLEKTGGVFSYALYEAIVNGPHTHRARDGQAREAQREAGPVPVNVAAGPTLMEFGYFHRRQEPRLNFSGEIQLLGDGFDFLATTRNVSPSGLRVYLEAPYRFEAGTRVTVDLAALGMEGVATVEYEVLKAVATGNAIELMLRLATEDPERRIHAAVERFIERQRGRYRLDVGDALHTTSAFFYERLYTDNHAQLLLYFGAGGEGRLDLDAVVTSRHNAALVEYFDFEHRSDFSAFCLPWRLQRLREGGELTLLVAHDPALGVCSWADADFTDVEDWVAALECAERGDARVFSVRGTPIPAKAVEKSLSRQAELVDSGGIEIADGESLLKRLQLLVQAADVTAEVLALAHSPAVEAPPRWCGGQRLGADGALLETLAGWRPPAPRMPHVVARGMRRERRYVARTPVTLQTGGGRLAGHTVDISRRGLRISCGAQPALVPGDAAQLRLDALQEKRRDLDLSRIPYRVIKLSREEAHCLLMLERVVAEEDPLSGFFDDLISRNRTRMKVERSDVESAALARLYDGVATTELATLPFFVRLDQEERACVEFCVTNRRPNPLAAFFRTDEGHFDFSALEAAPFVRQLTACLRARKPVEREGECAFGFLFRRGLLSNSGAVECEPLDWGAAVRMARQEQWAAGDLCFVKVVLNPVEPFSEIEVDQAALAIFEQSQFKAMRFKETLDSIAGVGELIDLTAQVRRAAGLDEVVY